MHLEKVEGGFVVYRIVGGGRKYTREFGLDTWDRGRARVFTKEEIEIYFPGIEFEEEKEEDGQNEPTL